MVATVYGQPAVLVPQPDGTRYRVSEYPNGTCRCSCPAYRWNRHNAGRWVTVDGKHMCKHSGAILEQIIKPSQEPKG